MTSPLLQFWTHTAAHHAKTTVLPDGCRDVILRQRPTEPPEWLVSSLDDAARHVSCLQGERFVGIRLAPGAVIDESALLSALSPVDDFDGLAEDIVRAHVRLDPRLHEALGVLATSPRVSTAARTIGVSERTLQRTVLTGTHRSPAFWRGLARVRRAAKSLGQPCSLGQVALANGFADQAHMTREFQRWFRCSPHRLRQRADLLALVTEEGYA